MIKKTFTNIFVACAFVPTALFGKTVELPPGSFEVPESVQILDQKEVTSAETGKAQGMVVFGPKDGLPRAVFIVAYVVESSATPSVDPLEAAVKIGNPFDPSLTGKDARKIDLGGAQAGLYSGTLPNGLVVRSYVVSNKGYRITVLLKGPSRSPYKEMMEAFATGLEQFRWAAQQPAEPSASVKTDIRHRDHPASPAPNQSDQNALHDLLAGDTPMTADRLQTYLSIALSQPSPQRGLTQPGPKQDDWGTAVGRLVFSEKEKLKSLEFWTSIRGGDYLKGVLKKNGVIIDRFYGSTVISGEPKKETIPAITSEIVLWYSSKLREMPQ